MGHIICMFVTMAQGDGNDLVLGCLIFLLGEAYSRWYYSRRRPGELAHVVYALRLGVMFCPVLDAFKLGS